MYNISVFALGLWNIKANLGEMELRSIIDMCINNGLEFKVSIN